MILLSPIYLSQEVISQVSSHAFLEPFFLPSRPLRFSGVPEPYPAELLSQIEHHSFSLFDAGKLIDGYYLMGPVISKLADIPWNVILCKREILGIKVELYSAQNGVLLTQRKQSRLKSSWCIRKAVLASFFIVFVATYKYTHIIQHFTK